jgi:glycosyltransferase involved in cell wall biosynthesis
VRNILFVIDNLGSGGAQRQLVSLAGGLKDRGHSVSVFMYHDALYFKEYLDEKGVPVFLEKKTARFSPGPVFAIRRLISNLAIDTVVSFLDTPNIYAELACIGKDVSLIVSERSSYVSDKISLQRRFISCMHLLADVVVANSRSHASWLSENFPFLRKRVRSIVNGIDSRIFKPASENIPKTEAGLHFVGVGRISSEKNIKPLISSLSLLRKDDFEVVIHWAGRVGSEKYFSECDSMVRALHLEDSWKWLGERKDVPDLLPQYDALVISSTREGFPNVAAEALSCGLPVLGSRISDIPFLLGDGERGLLFNPHDSDDIFRTLCRFIDLGYEARVEMGQRAREFVKKEISMSALVDNYEVLFSSLD